MPMPQQSLTVILELLRDGCQRIALDGGLIHGDLAAGDAGDGHLEARVLERIVRRRELLQPQAC